MKKLIALILIALAVYYIFWGVVDSSKATYIERVCYPSQSPSPSPSDSPLPSPSVEPSPTVSPEPSDSPLPSVSPSPSVEPSQTPSPSYSPDPTLAPIKSDGLSSDPGATQPRIVHYSDEHPEHGKPSKANK